MVISNIQPPTVRKIKEHINKKSYFLLLKHQTDILCYFFIKKTKLQILDMLLIAKQKTKSKKNVDFPHPHLPQGRANAA